MVQGTVTIDLEYYNKLKEYETLFNGILNERKVGKYEIYVDKQGSWYPQYILKEKDELIFDMQNKIEYLNHKLNEIETPKIKQSFFEKYKKINPFSTKF